MLTMSGNLGHNDLEMQTPHTVTHLTIYMEALTALLRIIAAQNLYKQLCIIQVGVTLTRGRRKDTD